MHTRPTSNIWKNFAASVLEEDRSNKRTKRKVQVCKRKTNGDGKDLWWIKSKIREGNKKLTTVTKRNRLNQEKQTSEEVIKLLRNLTSIRTETVPNKQNKLNHLQKNLERERGITQIMTQDNIELKKEIIQTQTEQLYTNGKCRIKKRNNADQSKTAADTNRVQWKDKWDQ